MRCCYKVLPVHKYSKWVILAHWKVVARQQDDIICDKDEAAYTLEATGQPETIKSLTFNEITAGDTRGVGTKIDLTQLTGEPMRAKNTADRHTTW